MSRKDPWLKFDSVSCVPLIAAVSFSSSLTLDPRVFLEYTQEMRPEIAKLPLADPRYETQLLETAGMASGHLSQGCITENEERRNPSLVGDPPS